MKRAEQGGEYVGVKRAVSEWKIAKAVDCAALFQDAQVRVESDFPQRDDNLNVGEQFQFTLEEWTAVAQFVGCWAIAGWRTVRGGGDPGVVKLKAVLCMAAFRLRSEPGAIQRAVQKVTGTISGEHTSSSIGTMSAGRQTEDQQPGRDIAERRHRFPPVIPVKISAPPRNRDTAAVGNQAWTPLAGHDLPIEGDQATVVDLTGFR